MIIDELITDRTKNDVVYGNPKGKYDFEDYNRVGEATNYVAQELINGGYDVSATAKTDWQNTDIPKDTDIEIYIGNVKAIVNALEMNNQLPITPKNVLTILGANQIEQALKDADYIINRIMDWNDVDSLDYDWRTLDSKNINWNSYFVRKTQDSII